MQLPIPRGLRMGSPDLVGPSGQTYQLIPQGASSTTDEEILERGLDSPGMFDVACSRQFKSPALLGALVAFVAKPDFEGLGSDNLLLTLLGEPYLTTADLLAMTRPGEGFTSPALLGGICRHHLADTSVFVSALWNAYAKLAVDVGTDTGSLLPAVIWRFGGGTHAGRLNRPGPGLRVLRRPVPGPGHAVVTEVAAAHASWLAWVGEDQSRHSFLAASAFTVDVCVDLLVIGESLFGPQFQPPHP